MLRRLFHALTLSLFTTLPLMAGPLAGPEGEVLLTVTGNIATTNAEGAAQLDLAQLTALERTVIETSTTWTDGIRSFEGVSLAALVDALGLEGETLRATAINDYAVDIPMSDAVEGGPIVAYLLDSQLMSVRDKGPLWIIYPYDDKAEYRTEVIYSRSIWQLNRIEAVD